MVENNSLHPLIVSLEYPPALGGGGAYVDSLVRDLLSVDDTLDISVLTSGEYDEDYFDRARPSVHVFRRHAAKQALSDTIVSAAFINDFNDVISEAEPNVIHAHHSVPIIALKGIALHRNLPSLYTQHRTPELPGRGYKLDGKGVIGELATSLPGNGHWIAPSQFFRSRLVSSGVPEENVSVVWPSADYGRFNPVNQQESKKAVQDFMPYDEHKKLVVLPAVPRPRKDVPFALEALSNTNTAVVVTGLKNDSQDDIQLRQQFSNTELIPHAPLSQAEVATLMNAADAIVLPSTHEGFGIAGIEALSTGAPTFLRKAPGLNEIASELGFVQQFETTNQLRKLVMNAVALTLNERRMQHNVIRQTFSAEDRANSHLKLYRHAIERQGER